MFLADLSTMENWIKNYDLAIRKHKVMRFAATWRGLENIMLSDVSQKKRDQHRRCLTRRDLGSIVLSDVRGRDQHRRSLSYVGYEET